MESEEESGTEGSKAHRVAKKKGWGNIVDSDGGADVEYGQQTVSERNDFSEKQYESDDPNDDENGYTGDYNTPETTKIDDDDGEESLVQKGSKAHRVAKKKGWGNIVDSDG